MANKAFTEFQYGKLVETNKLHIGCERLRKKGIYTP